MHQRKEKRVLVKARTVLCSLILLLAATYVPSQSIAAVTIVPWTFADGTIIDDNGDGIPEPNEADFTFDGAGNEMWGIQLSRDEITHDVSSESRVFFEYKLNAVTFAPPVWARLTFALRGSWIWNGGPVNGNVQVHSYPSDLWEWPLDPTQDFSGEPAVLQGTASIGAFQPDTEFSICVSDAVNTALSAGDAGVAFRFQIDPASEAELNLAHIDARDDSPEETKPILTVSVPGDTNADDIVDLVDFYAFAGCLKGPGASTSPLCRSLDLDCDSDIDLSDFARFQTGFTGTP